MAEQFSLRLPKGTKERLQQLANAKERTKSFLAQEAIEKYLELESRQINAIREGIQAVDNNEVVSYEDIKNEWDLK